MRYLITFLLITISLSGYSQFFIGDSKQAVKSVLHGNNVKITEDKLTDSTSRISWLVENEFQAIWVLDIYGKVIRQTIIPEKKNGVNDFVKRFNRDFVVISDTEWKNYSQGILYHIKLEYIVNEPIFSVILTRLPNSDMFAPH